MNDGMTVPRTRRGRFRAWAALAAAGFLAACGGGGGGDDGGGGGNGGGGGSLVPVPAASVAINQGMAQDLVLSLGLVADSGTPPAGGTSTTATAAGGGSTFRPAFTPDGSTACPGGGTVVVTHPGGDPTAGPEVNTYNNCTDLLGNVTTGQVIFNAVSTAGNTATVSAEWSMFKIAFAGSGYLLMHGDISSTIQSAALLTTVDSTINSLQIQSQVPGNPVVAFLVTNATSTTVTNSDTVTHTTSYMYTLASTLWNGAVDVATQADLVTTIGDPFPSSGQVLITGAGNTKALITFNNDMTVRVQIDADGDGNFEFDQTYTWTQLEG